MEGKSTFISLDYEKAVEAACYVIAQAGELKKKLTRWDLLKILYASIRESVRETGYVLYSDRLAAMEYGPAPSETYDLIKGESSFRKAQDLWSKYIRSSPDLDVTLKRDPLPPRLLSRRDLRILKSELDRWLNCSQDQYWRWIHSIREWELNKPDDGSSNPIEWEDLFNAVGRKGQAAKALDKWELEKRARRLYKPQAG